MEVNLEAEYSLLGSILKKGELIKEITLDEKHFYDAKHKLLFKTLREIEQKNEPIDMVTVITNMNQDTLKYIGGKKYLASLVKSVASLESFKTYESYIFESWKIREAKRIQEKPITNSDDLVQVMSEFQEIEQQFQENDDYDHKESVMKLYNKIINQPKGLSGYDTGYKALNDYLSGFQRQDLIISAARPSMGKTALMLNHAIHHCENGGISAIFSLEMGEESLNKRLLSTIGRIDGAKMRNPNEYFHQSDWDAFNKAVGILGDYNLHIYDDAGQTTQYIRSKIKKLKAKYPGVPILVMIDYLQLMTSTRKFNNRNEEVGAITRDLKLIAREEDVPVYLLSQLSRKVEDRQNKRPMPSDLRESGSIEQDADVIEFLYRDDYYDPESEKKNIIEVIISKQRNGPVGTVELAFNKEYNLFTDLSHDT